MACSAGSGVTGRHSHAHRSRLKKQPSPGALHRVLPQATVPCVEPGAPSRGGRSRTLGAEETADVPGAERTADRALGSSGGGMPTTSLVAGVGEGEDEQATARRSQAAGVIDQDGEHGTHPAYSTVFSEYSPHDGPNGNFPFGPVGVGAGRAAGAGKGAGAGSKATLVWLAARLVRKPRKPARTQRGG
jgi:hypothetical protein